MVKDDEKWFLTELYKRSREEKPCLVFGYVPGIERVRPRDMINELGFPLHRKRAWYLLEKWGNKNWYEWGVTMDLGWLTEEGIEKAQELLGC